MVASGVKVACQQMHYNRVPFSDCCGRRGAEVSYGELIVPLTCRCKLPYTRQWADPKKLTACPARYRAHKKPFRLPNGVRLLIRLPNGSHVSGQLVRCEVHFVPCERRPAVTLMYVRRGANTQLDKGTSSSPWIIMFRRHYYLLRIDGKLS